MIQLFQRSELNIGTSRKMSNLQTLEINIVPRQRRVSAVWNLLFRSLPPRYVSGAADGCLAGSALVCPIKKDIKGLLMLFVTLMGWQTTNHGVQNYVSMSYLHHLIENDWCNLECMDIACHFHSVVCRTRGWTIAPCTVDSGQMWVSNEWYQWGVHRVYYTQIIYSLD